MAVLARKLREQMPKVLASVAVGFLSAALHLEGRIPVAVGLIAACPGGRNRRWVTVGALWGILVTLPFGPGLRAAGAIVIVLAVLSAFRDTKISCHPLFAPATAAGATLAVELSYILQLGMTWNGVLSMLASSLLSGGVCHYGYLLRGRGGCELPLKEKAGRRLSLGADALKTLGESMDTGGTVQKEENPAVIFDRAAETVCRTCGEKERCWQREYVTTFNVFNDATPALLERGKAEAEDFPPYFQDSCTRFPKLVEAITAETRGFLLRRQYRRELSRERRKTRAQYTQLTELVAEAMAVQDGPEPCEAKLTWTAHSLVEPKQGERVSGDTCTYFQSGDRLYLLLSDGMGSGPAAEKESRMTVRLLEQLLKAGIQAEPALRTVNAAMNLRGDESGAFTTIDLLELSLGELRGKLYKYGAAPTYVKKGTALRRLTGRALPAGLQDAASKPETVEIPVEAGMVFVMVSDGVADTTDDAWLRETLSQWQGDDPVELCREIMAGKNSGAAEDDRSVLCLCLRERGRHPRHLRV